MTWPDAPGREPETTQGAVEDGPCRMIRAVPVLAMAHSSGPQWPKPHYAQKGVPIRGRSTIGRQRLPDGKMKSTPPRCARPLLHPAKKSSLSAHLAPGDPCRFAALPNFENFVQAAVKAFLAMNEQTQSLPASRPLWGNVRFGPYFVCFTPRCGRGSSGSRESVVDPQRKFWVSEGPWVRGVNCCSAAPNTTSG